MLGYHQCRWNYNDEKDVKAYALLVLVLVVASKLSHTRFTICLLDEHLSTRVCSVDEQMDEYDIPYDVIWLDIEYTDGKRYFTWDTNKFPKPEAMLGALVAKGRNLVTIIDPHLKADTGYAVYREARDRDLLVKTKDRQNFEGEFLSSEYECSAYEYEYEYSLLVTAQAGAGRARRPIWTT